MVTQGEYWYFVIIADDYNRATWIYYLRCKLHAFHVIKTFCRHVKTQFYTTVKIVRSDNALEFRLGLIDAFFLKEKKDCGIVHQTSYVDRS